MGGFEYAYGEISKELKITKKVLNFDEFTELLNKKLIEYNNIF